MVIVAAISAAPRSTSMPPVKYAGSRASGTRPGILGLSRAAGPASALDLEAAMTVDVHAHFWTDDYLDKVAALSRTGTAALRGRGAGDGAELDARLALMDRAGVGMQVLSASPGCWPSSGRNHWCSLPVPRTATATPACSWSARSLSRCPGSPITTTSASTCSSGRHGGASSRHGRLPPPDSAARAEAVLQRASIWVVCVGAVADGERGGAAGGF